MKTTNENHLHNAPKTNLTSVLKKGKKQQQPLCSFDSGILNNKPVLSNKGKPT